MTYLIAAVLLWALLGVLFVLFFLDPVRNWISAFNTRHATTYAQTLKKVGQPADVPHYKRILGIVEAAAFFLGTLMFLNPVFGVWWTVATFFAIVYVAHLLKAREARLFDDQMVDIAYTMKNSLKAGMTLQQAMHLIATEFPPPASEHFRIAIREIQLGATVEDALHHIEERVSNPEMKSIVTAVEILRQTGGNMIETFELLVETLKNRKRVEGKIRALTAQGRMGAMILCAMPFVMALILYFLNRPYIEPLFTTILGNIILTIVLMLVSTGWVIIQKVITIEV